MVSISCSNWVLQWSNFHLRSFKDPWKLTDWTQANHIWNTYLKSWNSGCRLGLAITWFETCGPEHRRLQLAQPHEQQAERLNSGGRVSAFSLGFQTCSFHPFTTWRPAVQQKRGFKSTLQKTSDSSENPGQVFSVFSIQSTVVPCWHHCLLCH